MAFADCGRAQDGTRQKPQSGRPGRHLDYRGPLPRS